MKTLKQQIKEKYPNKSSKLFHFIEKQSVANTKFKDGYFWQI